MAEWYKRKICGVILDITGVLIDSGPGLGTAIPGSLEAVKKLIEAGIPLRFCTNETTCTRKSLVDKLTSFGFPVEESLVFPPIPAMCKILQERSLRPHLMINPASAPDFEHIDQQNPNCVVIGDSEHNFTYENLNTAFQVLMSLEKPILFSLGKGKYYQSDGKLVLDVGAYMKALEYNTTVVYDTKSVRL